MKKEDVSVLSKQHIFRGLVKEEDIFYLMKLQNQLKMKLLKQKHGENLVNIQVVLLAVLIVLKIKRERDELIH